MWYILGCTRSHSSSSSSSQHSDSGIPWFYFLFFNCTNILLLFMITHKINWLFLIEIKLINRFVTNSNQLTTSVANKLTVLLTNSLET